ncbi:MAG: hypothetical protein H7A44_10980 [Opitutaceae bacterium]|nr:hypothetical protein [Opitutaceae bacterium]
MAATPEAPTKTPWHLWVVGVLTLVWNAVGAFDFVMTQTQNEAYMKAFTPEQLEYFYSFPSWVVLCWGIATWGALIGSMLLLLRNRLAHPVFLVSFLAMVITTIHNFVLSDGLQVMGGIGVVIFSAVIFVVALLLVIYAKAMRRRGVLK